MVVQPGFRPYDDVRVASINECFQTLAFLLDAIEVDIQDVEILFLLPASQVLRYCFG